MRKKENRTAAILMAPAVGGLFLFYVLPMLATWKNSFYFGGEFVGLENYQLTFGNYMFQLAVKNTLKFFLIGLPLVMVLSLGLSLLLFEQFPLNRFYRLSFLYPLIVPVASTVMVAQIFLNDKGILNRLLLKMGLPAQEWLQSDKAFWILILLFLWKNIGYNIILLLAGLAMIPKEYEEMSRLDGAGSWNYFWHIRLPLIKPMLFFTLLISILNGFKCFREAFLLGGTRPHESIYMIQHFMNNYFGQLNYARLSVVAVVILVLVGVTAGGIYGSMIRKKKGDDVF